MAIPRRVLVALASASALAAASVPVLVGGHAQATAFSISKLNKIQQRLVSAELINELGPIHAAAIGGDDNGGGADGAPNGAPGAFSTAGLAGRPANYFPAGNANCSANFGTNVKVNTNCLNVSDSDLQGRGQANNETSIAEDPLHPTNLVASNNDYVRGDGTCGASYSTDRGQTWNNSTVPDIFTRGTAFGGVARQYWQAGGDTSVAWDTKGNAYLSCQVFNRGTVASNNPDQSSGFLVFRSTGNNGASWDFPGRIAASAFDPTGTGAPFEDKQLIAVDNHLGSHWQDRVYVTWTEFAADGSAYIWEAYSMDYGQTFSPRVLVSGNNSTLCTVTFGAGTPQGNCNENQFSDPFTGPDGNLYVAFNNFNNSVSGNDNRNQVLLAKSTNGGASFSPPVKVSDYYDLPDCDTYQGAGADSGRACVPEKAGTRSVFRATNYPSGQVNPTNSNQVIVTFGSYINADSNENNGCVPNGLAGDGQDLYTGVKTVGACNNKILISTSTTGGGTFTGTSADPRTETMVTQARGQNGTDQWWQWAAMTINGELAVSYYDRQYGTNELTGNSDFSISGSINMVTFGQSRVTTSSLPPPTQFYGPNGGQFWGDYTGLTAVDNAYPIWSDTRSPDIFVCPGSATGPGNPPQLCTATENNGLQANDEEIYTNFTRIPLP